MLRLFDIVSFTKLIICANLVKITVTVIAMPNFDFEEPDYSHLNRNATRCSSTKLSFEKETLLHTWDLNGFLKYMIYLKRFEQSFEIKTEEVNFKSDNIDGKWIFKFSKLKPPLSRSKRLSRHVEEPPSSKEVSPMKISAMYSYEAQEQKIINFGIFLTIVHDNRELVLPLQTSSDPVISQQRTYASARANSPQFFTFTHSFTWPDVHEEFDSMVIASTAESTSSSSSPSSSSSSSTSSASGTGTVTINSNSNSGTSSQNEINEEKHDLSLRFLITAYYPNDPQFSNGENCNDELLNEISLKSSGNVWPPFMRHTNSMLNDDKYMDLFLRVGNEEFPAHRIILATTSPVFSSLIYNETFLFNHAHDNTINENGSHPSGSSSASSSASTSASASVSSSEVNPNILSPNPTTATPPPTVIQIDDDINGETVEEMLRYIYTGKVENLNDLAVQLMLAADRYGLPELKRICERVILTQVKLQNSIEMYILGMQVDSNKLTKKAFAIMRANKAKIVSQSEEFRKLSIKYPSLMFELFVS